MLGFVTYGTFYENLFINDFIQTEQYYTKKDTENML